MTGGMGRRVGLRGPAAWLAGLVGLATVVIAGTATPQGNIDAGKTPAQLFADTCSNCHRRPGELKRGASASFLRQHYTPGAQEAAAMAAYLASVPASAEPKGGKAKAPPEKDKEKTKVQQAQNPQDRLKQLPKGKRPGDLAKGPPEPPPEPPEPRDTVAAVPKLEPFEE